MSPPIFSGPRAERRRLTIADDAEHILELHHVSASYGPYRALFDVSFTVPAGGVVALIGSNGAGKSTVARTATGLLPATSGSVTVGGVDVTRLSAWRIARLGVSHVVEGRGVFSSLTVEENLVLTFNQRAGRRSVAGNLQRAYEAFPILGERRKQTAGTLSGGQQRLLCLAKVLVVPSKLLVADELSLGLAPVVVDAVYNGLQEINRNGTALLVVEQQVHRVLALADKAVVLDRGTVAYEGDPDGAAGVVERLISRREAAGSEAAAAVQRAVADPSGWGRAAGVAPPAGRDPVPSLTTEPGTPPEPPPESPLVVEIAANLEEERHRRRRTGSENA